MEMIYKRYVVYVQMNKALLIICHVIFEFTRLYYLNPVFSFLFSHFLKALQHGKKEIKVNNCIINHIFSLF